MHDCSVSEVPKVDSLKGQSTMGHRMQRGANRKSYITKMFPDKPHGKLEQMKAKQKSNMPMTLKLNRPIKLQFFVFFLKPTAFTIKIESP